MNKKTLALIVGIICVVVTLCSVIAVRNTAIYDIPVIKMLVPDEAEQLEKDFEKLIDEIEDAPDEEIEEFEEETGIKFEKMVKIVESPSLGGTTKLAKVMDDQEAIEIMSVINIVIIVYGAFIMLMSLLAALGKSRVLSIISLVISLPFYIFLVGPLGLIIFAVATIAHVVLLTQAKKAPPVAPVM